MRHMLLPTTVMISHLIAKEFVPELMKSIRVVMRVRISSFFLKLVWCLKDDRAQSEEIRCNLKTYGLGAFCLVL